MRAHRQYRKDYEDKMGVQRELYQKNSWSRVAVRVVVAFENTQLTAALMQEALTIEDEGTLTKRDREIVKEKYTLFNQELEEQQRVQQAVSIPNEVRGRAFRLVLPVCGN